MRSTEDLRRQSRDLDNGLKMPGVILAAPVPHRRYSEDGLGALLAIQSHRAAQQIQPLHGMPDANEGLATQSVVNGVRVAISGKGAYAIADGVLFTSKPERSSWRKAWGSAQGRS
jgi:hypothetical protein